MLKIAIDFHNTLADLTKKWLAMYNGEFQVTNGGRLYTHEDVSAWKMWEVMPITKERFWYYMDQINRHGVNAVLEPVEPNLAVKVTKLHNYYPTCEVLTASPPSIVSDIKAFLSHNKFPNLKVNSVGVPKAQGEVKFSDYDFQIYIDDNPYMVGKTPTGKNLILIDRPWNRSVTPNKVNEFRAKDWDEIIAYCHTLQGVL